MDNYIDENLRVVINGEAQLHALVDGKKIIITESSIRRDLQLADEEGVDCLPNSIIFEQLALMEKPKRKDTQVPQPSGPTDIVVDEAVHKELGDSLMRATTIASSLEAEQDSGNITKTPMIHCSQEKIKTTQHNEIDSLKRRVKKLEQKKRSRTHRLKRLRKVGATARVESSGDEEDLEMFDVDALNGEEVFVARQNKNVVEEIVNDASVSTVTTTFTITTKEVTLAQALADLKSTKPKAKGIAFREPGESTTTILSQQLQDKGLS
ncbi:hypothetical protein Tco_0743659 [Tanacetum coccineum]